MKHRVILDTLILQGDDQPIFQNGFVETYIRDKELKGLLKSIDSTITFTGKGYDYLLNIQQTQGFTAQVPITIQEFYQSSWKAIHVGLISVAQIKWIEKIPAAEVKIDDNSFFSRIKNNQNIETYLYGSTSKNSIDITKAEKYQIEIFKPDDGTTYTPQGLYGLSGFRVFEAFKFLVEHISDGEVGFVSDVFDLGGEFEGLAIMPGKIARFKGADLAELDYNNHQIRLSFAKLFTEVYKKKNIAFKIETIANKPHLRIEKAETLFSGKNTNVEFANIDEIITETLTEELYASIKLGSEYLTSSEVDATALTYPSSADWRGFKRETWTIAGQSNIDRAFDLQGEFVTDSNIIEDIVVKGNDNYDDQWLFIETTVTDLNNGVAIQGQFQETVPPAAPFNYNPGLTNNSVAGNFYGYIPNSIIQFLNNITGGLFFAFKTANETLPTSGLVDLICQNDFTPPAFDDGGNYDETVSQYIVPAGGIYTFRVILRGFIGSGTSDFQIVFEQYDSTGTTLLSQEAFLNAGTVTTGISTTTRSHTFNCDANDKIKVRVGIAGGGTKVLMGNSVPQLSCSFACTNIINGGGGEYQGGDPANYRVLTHKFDYPISREDFALLEASLTDQFQFFMEGKLKKWGWIDRIRRDRLTGESQVQLFSSLNSSTNGT